MANAPRKDRMALAGEFAQGGEQVLPAEFWTPKEAGQAIIGVLNRHESRPDKFNPGEEQKVAIFSPVIATRGKVAEVFGELAVNVDVAALHALGSTLAVGGIFAVQFLGYEKSTKSENSYKDFLITRQTPERFAQLMKRYGGKDAADALPF